MAAAAGELVHSINNFVTSFSHNLFINSLLQRERGVSWGEICIQNRFSGSPIYWKFMAPGEPDTGPAGFKTIPGIFCGNGFLKKGHVELLESWKSVDKG